jgi:hypothetical protein
MTWYNNTSDHNQYQSRRVRSRPISIEEGTITSKINQGEYDHLNNNSRIIIVRHDSTPTTVTSRMMTRRRASGLGRQGGQGYAAGVDEPNRTPRKLLK